LKENFKVLKILLINGGNFVKKYIPAKQDLERKKAPDKPGRTDIRQTRTKTPDYQRGQVTAAPKPNVQENRKFAGVRSGCWGEQSCRKIIISYKAAGIVQLAGRFVSADF
jgi:hypothetical protein